MPGRARSASSALQQPVGAVAGQPAQPRRQAGPARLAAGDRGQERGEGLGLDVVGLARAGLHEGPDGPAQAGQEHPGQADGPRAALGLGAGDELADDGVAGLEAASRGAAAGPSAPRAGSAGRGGRRCRVPSRASGSGPVDEEVEGALQGVERRVGEGTAAGGHGQLLSLRSRHRATRGPPLFPRIDPSRPGRGTTPNPGDVAGESSPPRRVMPGQRRGVVATARRVVRRSTATDRPERNFSGEPGGAPFGESERRLPHMWGSRAPGREALAHRPGRGGPAYRAAATGRRRCGSGGA